MENNPYEFTVQLKPSESYKLLRWLAWNLGDWSEQDNILLGVPVKTEIED